MYKVIFYDNNHHVEVREIECCSYREAKQRAAEWSSRKPGYEATVCELNETTGHYEEKEWR